MSRDTGIFKIDKGSEKLVTSWLMLAIVSLIFAGLFAFLLAMARTPQIQDFLPGKDYFRVALVDHVVLSIVIWFLTFNGILWVLTSSGFSGRSTFSIKLGMAGFAVSAVGTACIIAPALIGLGTPMFTNYIPVLDHPLYYSGLFLFALGLFLYLINIVLTYMSGKKAGDNIFRTETFAMVVCCVAIFSALLCYQLAYFTFPDGLKKFIYLEHFFWGGGHILQFSNTIGMLVAWILLTKMTLKVSPVGDKWGSFLFALFLPFILVAPFLYFFYEGGTQDHKVAFTILMQYGYGPTVILIGFAVIRGIINSAKMTPLPWKEPGFSALFFSIILFATGGIFAIFIQESNTRIPAHYHGVIGAVTISFMGLTYYILPAMKRPVPCPGLARLQPYIYGVGQLLFVIGMFWAGGHGVARKTYGAAQGLDNFAKIAGMTMMGIGGLVAIAGGASYVYNVLFSILGKKESSQSPE
ncbi:MAG: cbb3-type cytochrome c oxidase subunit I [Deltaproteobacteria bacterium]|nr:cbb3-type cytochrome c oxidase subunit I [Deltaproteobacteria bacterium]